MGDWQEQQRQEETQLQREMLNVLNKCIHEPLSMDEAMLLAWGSGVSSDFYKEAKRG